MQDFPQELNKSKFNPGESAEEEPPKEEEKKEEMLISEDTCLKTGKHGPATAQIDKTLESEPKIINLLHLRMLLLGGAFPLT